MEITIKTFASISDLTGFKQKVFEFPDGEKLNDIINALSGQYEGLRNFKDRILFSVNEEYCEKNVILKNGDILAIFPTVSGG